MVKTYQYRIYPTTKQRKTLETILEGCQTLYNAAINIKKAAVALRGGAGKHPRKILIHREQKRETL